VKRRDPFVLCAILAAAAAGGCTSVSSRDTAPFDRAIILEPPTASERDGAALSRRDARSHGARIAQPLTLEEAQKLALEANPTLLATADGVDAAKARITEASVFTNPVFSFGKSDVPTKTGPITVDSAPSVKAWDLKVADTLFSLQKDLDVSGKRVARVDAAIENERQSEAQFVSAALQLKAQVRVAYASILVAERNLELSREARDMAQTNLRIVAGRAAGGNALPADGLRAEADASRSEGDFAQAERDLGRARRSLTTLLGDPEATLGPLRGELPLSRLPGDVDDARLATEALEHNADVIAAKRGVLAAEATLRLQNRSLIPDLTVALTGNRYILDHNTTIGFNLSIPVPIFDQNQGQVAEATALLHQAERTETGAENTVLQGVRDDLQILRVSRGRIERFENDILPKDREAVKLTESSYQGGKVLYLDVIGARGAFNQARGDYVNELLNYETTLADLERLLARPVTATPSLEPR
jgi:cobalt-zinc-cadmium efflux system outer membrane protein